MRAAKHNFLIRGFRYYARHSSFEACIIRHGDRTPIFNPFEGSQAQGSHEREWMYRIRTDEGIASARSAFPTLSPHKHTVDGHEFPWGTLSTLGLQQTRARGKVMRKYLDGAVDMNSAVVSATASNYERTQLSGASFLRGLLGDTPTASHADATCARIVLYAGRKDQCPIAAFESDVGLRERVRSLFRTPLFTEREQTMASHAKALQDTIPYFGGELPPLFHRHDDDFSDGNDGVLEYPDGHAQPDQENTDGSSGTYSGSSLYSAGKRFLWIRAADMFWTHRAHGIPLPFDGSQIEYLRSATLQHLQWRFATIYAERVGLRMSCGGWLRGILQGMDAWKLGEGSSDTGAGPDGRPGFALVSGHDVTSLPALLLLLRAHGKIQSAEGNGDSWMPPGHDSPWPVYASCLSFSLRKGRSKHTLSRDMSHTVPAGNGGGVEEVKLSECVGWMGKVAAAGGNGYPVQSTQAVLPTAGQQLASNPAFEPTMRGFHVPSVSLAGVKDVSAVSSAAWTDVFSWGGSAGRREPAIGYAESLLSDDEGWTVSWKFHNGADGGGGLSEDEDIYAHGDMSLLAFRYVVAAANTEAGVVWPVDGVLSERYYEFR